MEIISHRGYWNSNINKNSIEAFKNSFSKGFGTEIDFRDYNGKIIISHDIPKLSEIVYAEELLSLNFNNLIFAINIKSDGLHDLIKEFIDKTNILKYFVFDMSIPDTIGYLKKGMNVFIRQSEFEKNIPFYKNAKGIWLDSFENIWYDSELIKKHLKNNKKIAIVSSELHGRDHLEHWKKINSWNIVNNNDVILCTDFPEEAKIFFKI